MAEWQGRVARQWWQSGEAVVAEWRVMSGQQVNSSARFTMATISQCMRKCAHCRFYFDTGHQTTVSHMATDLRGRSGHGEAVVADWQSKSGYGEAAAADWRGRSGHGEAAVADLRGRSGLGEADLQGRSGHGEAVVADW